MEQDEPSKSLDRPAAEVCEVAGPGEAARGLLDEGMTVRTYLDALAAQGLHADALKVLAYALPKRAAVWWACLIAAEAMGPEPSPAAAAALETARAWVIDPKDERRRAAFPAAEAVGMGTPAGCTAAAAYFSSGSLAPPDLPVVPPREDVTGRLVAAALTLAAVIQQPERAPEKRAAFLRTGREVAEGQRPWPQAAPERSATVAREGGSAHAAARSPRL